MSQPHALTSKLDQVVDVMVTLTRLSHVSRAIVAGDGSAELCASLRPRGFTRIGMPAQFRLRRGGHAVGLMAIRDSIAAFDAALGQVAPFLGANATVAVLIASSEPGLSLKIRKQLEQLGFRIEAGVRSHRGLVLFADRQGYTELANAA
jgi:hypothetical protein